MEHYRPDRCKKTVSTFVMGELTFMHLPTPDCRPADSTTFQLANSYYAIAASHVQAVQPIGFYTPLPFIHPCIVGVANRNNGTLGILDIRPLTEQTTTPPHPHSCLVIVHLDGMDVGLLADAVVDSWRTLPH